MTTEQFITATLNKAADFKSNNALTEHYTYTEIVTQLEKGATKEDLLKGATLSTKDGAPSSYMQLFADNVYNWINTNLDEAEEATEEATTTDQLDYEVLKREAISVFDHLMYDSIILAAIRLFGDKAVTVDIEKNKVIVKDKVCIVMSLSFNEPKIYFYSYDTPQLVDRSLLTDINPVFRLLSASDFLEYLQMKAKENTWIRNNEG